MNALAQKTLPERKRPLNRMSLHEIQTAVENIHMQRDLGKIKPEQAEQQIRDLLNEQIS